MRWQTGILVTALVLGASGAARGQDVAASDALFNKGVEDMTAGRFDTGCPAIAESLRLDPQPGTLFTLAECYRKAGKFASAVARYDEYLSLFARMTPEEQEKQLGREKISQEQRDAIKPQVSFLTIRLPAGAPSGIDVKRDDVSLGAPSLGIALPVDPGSHTISTVDPNGKVTSKTVTIAPSERKEVTVELEPGKKAPPDTPSKPGTPGTTTQGADGSTQRIAGIVVGSVGLAGLVLGAITGGLVLAEKSTIDDNCDNDAKSCRNQEGLDAVDSAQAIGLASTVGFIAGGALLATGLIVFFTAPASSAPAVSARVSVGPSEAAFGLGVTF